MAGQPPGSAVSWAGLSAPGFIVSSHSTALCGPLYCPHLTGEESSEQLDELSQVTRQGHHGAPGPGPGPEAWPCNPRTLSLAAQRQTLLLSRV